MGGSDLGRRIFLGGIEGRVGTHPADFLVLVQPFLELAVLDLEGTGRHDVPHRLADPLQVVPSPRAGHRLGLSRTHLRVRSLSLLSRLTAPPPTGRGRADATGVRARLRRARWNEGERRSRTRRARVLSAASERRRSRFGTGHFHKVGPRKMATPVLNERRLPSCPTAGPTLSPCRTSRLR